MGRHRPGRRTPKQRGYGVAHGRLRAAWKPLVEAGGVQCARCGELIKLITDRLGRMRPEPWDLGHDDWDRAKYNGPEHAGCNRSAASLNKGATPPVGGDRRRRGQTIGPTQW